EVPSFFNFL
ncbi:hypothetical protein VCHENC02_3050B, partial [Vibrio harveyi]